MSIPRCSNDLTGQRWVTQVGNWNSAQAPRRASTGCPGGWEEPTKTLSFASLRRRDEARNGSANGSRIETQGNGTDVDEGTHGGGYADANGATFPRLGQGGPVTAPRD